MDDAQRTVADRFTQALARADGHRWTHATEARRDILRKHYEVAVRSVMDTSAVLVEEVFHREPFLVYPPEVAEYLRGGTARTSEIPDVS